MALAEEKVKRQQVITLHLVVSFTLVITGVFVLLWRYFTTGLPADKAALIGFSLPGWLGSACLMGGLLLLGFILFRSQTFLNRIPNRNIRAAELLVLLCFASYAAIHGFLLPALIYGVLSGALFFAIYWESVSDNTLYIGVDERGIRLPVTARKRFLAWHEVESVLLRFGILTIDCYDNRLFQWNIKTITFDKDQFQKFCLEHIMTHKEKHKQLEW